jgi:hypothetical protein
VGNSYLYTDVIPSLIESRNLYRKVEKDEKKKNRGRRGEREREREEGKE